MDFSPLLSQHSSSPSAAASPPIAGTLCHSNAKNKPDSKKNELKKKPSGGNESKRKLRPKPPQSPLPLERCEHVDGVVDGQAEADVEHDHRRRVERPA